jgi:hypothetical protein
MFAQSDNAAPTFEDERVKRELRKAPVNILFVICGKNLQGC